MPLSAEKFVDAAVEDTAALLLIPLPKENGAAVANALGPPLLVDEASPFSGRERPNGVELGPPARAVASLSSLSSLPRRFFFFE